LATGRQEAFTGSIRYQPEHPVYIKRLSVLAFTAVTVLTFLKVSSIEKLYKQKCSVPAPVAEAWLSIFLRN
jgi:hypothetical protein